MKKNTFVITVTIVLVMLFLYTGATKLFGYSEFLTEFRQSPLYKKLPSGIVLAVPIAELAIVIVLLIKQLRLYGLYGSLGLLALFSWYLILLNQTPYYVPCSCGGVLEALPLPAHIALNLILALFSIVAIYFEIKLRNAPPKLS